MDSDHKNDQASMARQTIIVKKKDCPREEEQSLFCLLLIQAAYFAASREALRKAFMAFSISRDALRARVPAALLPASA